MLDFFGLIDASTLITATKVNKVTLTVIKKKNYKFVLCCTYNHKSEIERLMVATTCMKKKNAVVGFLKLVRNRKHYAN